MEEDGRGAGRNRAKSRVGWARRAEKEIGPAENKIMENENKMGGTARCCGPKTILGCQEKMKMFLKYFGYRFEFEAKV
jgi:hypothetical protein